MAEETETKIRRGSKVKKWVINLLMAVIVTVAMLSAIEVAMRWIDGYQLSTLELHPDAGNPSP
jgi:hypothetical protein